MFYERKLLLEKPFIGQDDHGAGGFAKQDATLPLARDAGRWQTGAKVGGWVSNGRTRSRAPPPPLPVQVYLKPTQCKQDQVCLRALAHGGYSGVPADKRVSASLGVAYATHVGPFGLPPTELKELLANHSVGVAPQVTAFGRTVTGDFSPLDAEVALQLLCALFLRGSRLPKRRATEEWLLAMLREHVQGGLADPDRLFGEKTVCHRLPPPYLPRAGGCFVRCRRCWALRRGNQYPVVALCLIFLPPPPPPKTKLTIVVVFFWEGGPALFSMHPSGVWA